MAKRKQLAQLSVWLNQTLVGSITELANDRNLFPFDRSYVENPHRPVLSLSFTDAEGGLISQPVETQMRVPPFFSNLLPEDELRRYVAMRAGVKAFVIFRCCSFWERTCQGRSSFALKARGLLPIHSRQRSQAQREEMRASPCASHLPACR